MAKKLDNVIEFYGETCPHCISMKPVVEELEKKRDIEITKLEVWNNDDNYKLMQKYAEIIGEACGGLPGVPAFVNTETMQALCGAHDADDIEGLIDGADCSGNECKAHTKHPKK